MPYYKAALIRTDAAARVELGSAINHGKMNTFRLMQDEGEKICSALSDCGEFEFVWNGASKVWEFFNETGGKVGYIKIEIDAHKEAARAERYARERRAACRALPN